MAEVELTLDRFVSSFKKILAKVNELDPDGADSSLRLTVSFSLYACFDALRCQERAFDRPAFWDRIGAVEAMLGRCPGVTGPKRAPTAERRHSIEDFVAELYSRCWAKYDDQAFAETIELFEERFRLNRIETAFLKGADCLDAGCGSGRYTLAMAKLGARRSVGIDISRRAVEEAAQRSRRLGFGPAVTFCQGSVIDMPREWTETFDFVCSNGVVHHTTNPTAGLQEIFRVLRPGGRAYVFVYGSGGLFWALVDLIRALVAPVPLEFADAWLQSLGISPGKIFNSLDHWYTPKQERLTQQEFESRLANCGFTAVVAMPRAKVYDASERRVRFPEERDLVGDGDLRYLVLKAGQSSASRTTAQARPETVAAR